MLLLQKATEEVTRLQERLSRGLITPAAVEQAERDMANFESQINAKDAQIASLNAQIRSVQQRIRAKEDNVAKAAREFEKVGAVSSSLAQIRARSSDASSN
jgi:peptidoglycan hydrolase CwlO-like protein